MRPHLLGLLVLLLLCNLGPIVHALPFLPDAELDNRVLAYYRFDETPRASAVMVDSRNLRNSTYPAHSQISQRTWALGGELRNKALALTGNSLVNGPIILPIMDTTTGISVSFLLETDEPSRKQSLVKIVSDDKFLVHLFMENGQLTIMEDTWWEPTRSNRRLISGALHHIILSMDATNINVYVDGRLEIHQLIYLDRWIYYPCTVYVGRDPDERSTHLVGYFDELMVFDGLVHSEDPKVLYDSYIHGSLPICSDRLVAIDSFEGIPDGTSLEDLGTVGPCSWGTPWATNAAVVYQERLTFNEAATGLHATRFTSVPANAGSLAFTGRMLDLCRVEDPEEPMNDLVGYCRSQGKLVTISLCANDGYCITFGVATASGKFVYRLGYFMDPLNYIGSIPRPMFPSYPQGVFFKVEVTEDLKVAFMYGSSPDTLQSLVTNFYLPVAPPLTEFNILRLIIGSANNEPGVFFEDLHIYSAPPTVAPLQCDAGEYLADNVCRPCPANTTSPIGSTSKSQCVCGMGSFLDICGGDPLCEEQAGRDDFTFERFTDFSLLHISGNTSIAPGNIIRLTPSSKLTSSQVFYLNPVDLYTQIGWDFQEVSFSSHFVFLINGNGGYDVDGPGADGMAFVMASEIPAPGPHVGSNIGYGGINPSVVVEFDTWENFENDINGNHVGININGDLRSATSAAVSPLFTNGQPWYCWVDYDAAHVVLEVRLSLSNQRPAEPNVRLYQSVASILNSQKMYVGFTASTGGAFSSHHLLSWDFSTPAQGTCLPCYEGSYKDHYGNGGCSYCPPGSWSTVVGSVTEDDCLCFPGNERTGAECTPCPVDYYSPEYGSYCQPCPPHSETFGTTGNMYCACKSGYYMNETGHCVDINECSEGNIDCQNGGTCHNEDGSYECICLPGWRGMYCERDVNECLYYPCWNDGECENTPGSFVCHCPPGWTGNHCQTDVNECLEEGSCSPNANCTNTVGSYTCTCHDGWVGDGFDCHVPRGPVFLTPGDGDVMGRMVLVKWIPEEHFNPLQYNIEIDVKPFGSVFEVDAQRTAYGAVEQALLTSLTPNSEMRMRVYGINKFGASPLSNIINVKTLPSYPEAPVISGVTIRKDDVVLTWTPGNSNGALVTGYLIQLYRNDSYSTVISETVPASETTLVIDQLIRGVNYIATVTTQSNYGNSEQSAGAPILITGTPTSAPTSSPRPTSPTDTPSASPSIPGEQNKGGMIAGLIIGVLAFVAILVGAALYYRHKMLKKDGHIRLSDDPSPPPGRSERRQRFQRSRGKEATADPTDNARGDLSLLNPTAGDNEEDINVNTGFVEDAEAVQEEDEDNV